MNINELQLVYQRQFEDNGLKKGVYSAPGRVNLIGEHTDYNDGFVLPMAIDRTIDMVGQLREDRKFVAYSVDYEQRLEFSLESLQRNQEYNWINYLMGVVDELQQAGYHLQGANLAFTGNIPQGAGLSSSAALEVVTAFALADLNSLEIKPVEMARLCQRAENNFVGVDCGIMDQYISRLGEKDHALLIDCRSNEYELTPFKDENYRVVICDSRVQRGLVDSEYNKRRQECNQATEFFDQRLEHKVEALRDVSCEQFEKYAPDLEEPYASRARHVISENRRVLQSVKALKGNDLQRFGQLMVESHQSLSDDYQVSCPELNLLVKMALEQEGVLGSRMTGAGFGGSTVNLVAADSIDDFKKKVKKGYRNQVGKEAEIYVSNPASGARRIE